MIEKVNPSHPDKIADRIAGALVDYAYTQSAQPSIAVEALIGHGEANIIAETSVHIPHRVLSQIIWQLAPGHKINYKEVAQDPVLAKNQSSDIRAGDNGIFKGVPISKEVAELSRIAGKIYSHYPSDGKYILDGNRLIICQSNASHDELKAMFPEYTTTINPLGPWIGGTYVDTGAVNRKLGSDMGEAVTGGGLHGKDLSKADVAVNIYAHLKAQETGKVINISCAIGDTVIDGLAYREIVQIAADYIKELGGFEKLAEWGLV